jgi:hypothetical protein
MKQDGGSLIALTVGCTVAAALFGLGSEVFSWRSTYEGEVTRAQIILLSRLLVYLTLAVLLVLRGGWWGVLAAVSMAVGATLVEWALFPFAYEWAAVGDPAGYAKKFGEEVERPTYGRWATFDIIGVGISAALAQGLRMMANVNPRGPQDE